MTRLIAILVALLFALGAVSVPMANAGGTTTKAPTKSDSPEARGGAGKPKMLFSSHLPRRTGDVRSG